VNIIAHNYAFIDFEQ